MKHQVKINSWCKVTRLSLKNKKFGMKTDLRKLFSTPNTSVNRELQVSGESHEDNFAASRLLKKLYHTWPENQTTVKTQCTHSSSSDNEHDYYHDAEYCQNE